LVVVDEAALALTGYRLTSPVESFYRDSSAYITTTAFRSHILLEAPVESSDEELAQPWDEPGDFEATEKISRYQSPRHDPFADLRTTRRIGMDPIQLRTQFAPLALFADSVVTDATGRASVKVKLPDSLTRYRVMAVAVAGARFGIGESTITAQLPLMVRSSSLRFLNFGDQCEFPVLVQNQTARPLTVDVAIRANHLIFPQGTCQRVTVPANDRVEVRFPVETTTPGTARVHIAGVAGQFSDAAEIVLPVYRPATTEAFAEQGSLEQGMIVQSLGALSTVLPDYGGVEVTTSSTQLQSLTDALLYLVNYEYACTEQLSSEILGVVVLRDVLSAFQSRDLPDPKILDSNVAESLNKLKSRQLGTGGFCLWDSGNADFPFASIHALHAVAKAKEKQYPVPDGLIERGKEYLRSIESVFKQEYSPESRQTMQAYALYVRHLLGESDVAQARELINHATPDQLPVEA
ncbi:MAG TPA: alpha-2-macroglobulin family protein, partial [Acidobacteriota bacterium]|nr:alpha-2-macroglobulin family protein [Acidobacteriota bacterium]